LFSAGCPRSFGSLTRVERDGWGQDRPSLVVDADERADLLFRGGEFLVQPAEQADTPFIGCD
jgi:hypothetical protein